ncbi:unnamed protein product [Schistosoma curassoni]|uniref:Tnp_DNA_bind domain-containing protein n=1 Tax=Schistosoma curassoni TaxID=6186 RepID=A0A183KWM0_9TREM|nr:unnamed protein product [Schistosoma curassoni]
MSIISLKETLIKSEDILFNAGNYRKPERLVKSKKGKAITNIEEQRNRWVEHFKELLNRPAPLNPPNI